VDDGEKERGREGEDRKAGRPEKGRGFSSPDLALNSLSPPSDLSAFP
jgi:hypothetical protein